ncbi:prenylated Rab acceptor protein 1-like [Oppia nitens]|uniref:prenylated Rab acceptor protein 1-like n=1 Tax=Oppia nitens TaxID=1686743 RepID=UPI0023DB27BF|nr:prenylated Rab acceptor protein 1-like [Oppia nitens]
MATKTETVSTPVADILSSEPMEAKTAEATSLLIDEPSGDLDGQMKVPAGHRVSRSGLPFNKLSPKEMSELLWSRLQSWGSFIDTNRMKTPNSTVQWSRRLVRNIEHFQSNYLCVSLILVIYCVLTSPLLLLAIVAIAGLGYIVMLKNAESPLKLFGYKFSLGQQYLFLMIISFPLFHLAGAGQAVFWVIGASFFVIGLHASLYAIEMQDTIENQLLNNLQNV